MPQYQMLYTKAAQKDALNLNTVGLKDKALQLLEIVAENPFQNPPPYEMLIVELAGA